MGWFWPWYFQCRCNEPPVREGSALRGAVVLFLFLAFTAAMLYGAYGQ